MAGLPKCLDAITNLRATAGDACFLGTDSARMFTRPGQFWKAEVGQFSKAPKSSEMQTRPPKRPIDQPSRPRFFEASIGRDFPDQSGPTVIRRNHKSVAVGSDSKSVIAAKVNPSTTTSVRTLKPWYTGASKTFVLFVRHSTMIRAWVERL